MDDSIVEARKGANGEHSRVAVCGECAPILWAQGKADAAIRLEELWNEIPKTYNLILSADTRGKAFSPRKTDTPLVESVENTQRSGQFTKAEHFRALFTLRASYRWASSR